MFLFTSVQSFGCWCVILIGHSTGVVGLIRSSSRLDTGCCYSYSNRVLYVYTLVPSERYVWIWWRVGTASGEFLSRFTNNVCPAQRILFFSTFRQLHTNTTTCWVLDHPSCTRSYYLVTVLWERLQLRWDSQKTILEKGTSSVFAPQLCKRGHSK